MIHEWKFPILIATADLTVWYSLLSSLPWWQKLTLTNCYHSLTETNFHFRCKATGASKESSSELSTPCSAFCHVPCKKRHVVFFPGRECWHFLNSKVSLIIETFLEGIYPYQADIFVNGMDITYMTHKS